MFEGVLASIRGESSTGDDTGSRGETAQSSAGVRGQYESPAAEIAEACGERTLGDLPAVADPFSVADGQLADPTRARCRRAGDARSVVTAHGVAADALVSAAFDELREECDGSVAETVDAVEAELSDALGTVFTSMETGVTAAGGTQVAADGGDGATVQTADGAETGGAAPASPGGSSKPFPLGYEALLDNIGTCLFVLNDDGEIVFWNRGAEKLTGENRADAYEYDMASRAFYHDGRRAKTLADKVLDAPESADEEYGVPRVDDVDYTLYRDRSTMAAAGGEEKHISFSAAPLYDDDGELVGAIEMVQDFTEDTRRRERTTELVSELQDTMQAMQAGDPDARAEYEYEGYIDEELLSVVDELNQLADQISILATLTEQAEQLYASSELVAKRSEGASDDSSSQRETMQQLSAEISNLSATVEEVASSAAQVDQTSSEAESLARDGQESAEEAVTLMQDVAGSADDATEDLAQLQDRIDEINEIVTVINDIADQTNILALNASIEAARAGEAGEGFAVVADEVKQLAEESQQNATEIEQLITDIQRDTDETVESLTETTRSINDVIEEVQSAMQRLSDIVEAVSEASQGVQEVADATDEQAASTEEVASMIDEATEQADQISADLDDIAEATREQMDKAEELRSTLKENTY